MTKPKTLEQLRAEKERAETQLAYSFDIALQNEFSLAENIYYQGIGALEVSKGTSSRQEREKRHSRSYTVSLLPHDVFLSGGTFRAFFFCYLFP